MPAPDEVDPGGIIFGVIVGVPACFAAAYFGWKRWKYKASERWPLVVANYEGARVEFWSSGEGGGTYHLVLNFSYEVAGKTYMGKYRKMLWGYKENEANAQVQSFEQGPLFVRHHPSKPRIYVMDPFRDVRQT